MTPPRGEPAAQTENRGLCLRAKGSIVRARVRACVCRCWFSLTLSVITSGALAGELGFCAAETQNKLSAVNVSVWSLQQSGFPFSAAWGYNFLSCEWIHDRDHDLWSTRTRRARMRGFCHRRVFVCMI